MDTTDDKAAKKQAVDSDAISARWVLSPDTAEAGSAPYELATGSTAIGRVPQGQTGSGSQLSQVGAHKILIDTDGNSGISRQHAELIVSKEGRSLKIVGQSQNELKVLRRTPSADAPVSFSLAQGSAGVTLQHDDRILLDGFRPKPRFVLRVTQELGSPPFPGASPVAAGAAQTGAAPMEVAAEPVAAAIPPAVEPMELAMERC